MIRYVSFLFLLSIYTCGNVCAQEQKTMLRVADEYLMRHEYATAAPLYEDAAKRTNDIIILRKLVLCYQAINNYVGAAATAKKITSLPGASAEDWLSYGDMLKCLARYDDAKAAYLKTGADTSTKIKERMAGCDSAVIWKQEKQLYELKNYEILNTALSDWGASYYPGNDVVFSSAYDRRDVLDAKAKVVSYYDKRTLEPFLKIYVLDSAAHDFIRGLAPVFNQYKFHTGPITFSADYTTAFFTITNVESIPYEKTSVKPKMKMGDRRLQLLISKKVNGTWQKPSGFAYNKPESYSVGHAALSKDGSVLYFASDMPGGFGKTDLWYCELQADSTWGAPHNCGPIINSDEEDDFPTINDDQGIYFSSKAHVGMGGLDIFYAKGAKNNWSVPLNMKSPINSEGDDFYFMQRTPGRGLLSSNRSGGKGSDDIYQYMALETPHTLIVRKTPAQVILQTTVMDEQKIVLSGASVWLDNTAANLTWLQHTDPAGNTYQIIQKKTVYNVTGEMIGYVGQSEQVLVDINNAVDTIKVVLILSKKQPGKQQDEWQKGNTFVLNNIYYDFDKWNIRADAKPELDKVADVLKSHPGLKIELSSHTDCRGSDEYNMKLSQLRAQSAVNYIIAKGVNANRIKAKGYGKTRLVNDCNCAKGYDCSKEAHQRNRRTEITVLE